MGSNSFYNPFLFNFENIFLGMNSEKIQEENQKESTSYFWKGAKMDG